MAKPTVLLLLTLPRYNPFPVKNPLLPGPTPLDAECTNIIPPRGNRTCYKWPARLDEFQSTLVSFSEEGRAGHSSILQNPKPLPLSGQRSEDHIHRSYQTDPAVFSDAEIAEFKCFLPILWSGSISKKSLSNFTYSLAYWSGSQVHFTWSHGSFCSVIFHQMISCGVTEFLKF